MTHVPQIFYLAINAYFILVRKKSSVLSQSELVLVLVSLTLTPNSTLVLMLQ